jgi:hypothetical protein
MLSRSRSTSRTRCCRRFPTDEFRETAAGGGARAPVPQTDSEWQQGIRRRLCHPSRWNRRLDTRKGRQPQALPMEQVLRYGSGDSRASGRKCCVSHHVALQRFHERYARVFAAPTTIGPPFIIRFGFQRDAEPLDVYGIASFIEPHSCNADWRVIPRATSRGRGRVRRQGHERQQDSVRLRSPGGYQAPAPSSIGFGNRCSS